MKKVSINNLEKSLITDILIVGNYKKNNGYVKRE
ncbi:hypothetical protein HNR33_001033 [Brassicibacter mesophilus]